MSRKKQPEQLDKDDLPELNEDGESMDELLDLLGSDEEALETDEDDTEDAKEIERFEPGESDHDATTLYLKEIGYVPLFTRKEELYFARLAAKGDEDAKSRMVQGNLRLVVKIAKRYIHRGLPLLDLIEEGNLGLMHALEKFDPERGFRFSTYASWWIKQNIERALLNQTHTIRVPVYVLKELNFYLRAARKLAQTLDHEPSAEELAEFLDRPVKDIKKILSATTAVDSIDALFDDSSRSISETISDQEGTLDQQIANNDFYKNLSLWMQQLDEREQEVLSMRYGLGTYEPMTLEEVGQAMELTRERVRQIQFEALKKLKKIMGNNTLTREMLLSDWQT
ncbi:MAG: polymerase sigma factor RpoS [Gammaproteobacteria bacterium]|jgi:RNA polymerase nonessential primary-like sigma factor|nr:polymerase sigma factor RpoS [Gammaproteobacteria bacterium]